MDPAIRSLGSMSQLRPDNLLGQWVQRPVSTHLRSLGYMSQLRRYNILGSLGTETSMDPSEVIGQKGKLRPGESLLGHWAQGPAWTH